LVGDVFIADATVHGYNWRQDNWAVPETAAASAAGFGFHQFLSPAGADTLTEGEFLRDWPTADIEEALFVEAGVDLAVYHGTPIYDLYCDGHSSTQKGIEWQQREPNRVMTYGAVNPLDGSAALRELERLADQGVNGIKVYAASYYKGRTLEHRLDDPDLGYPFIEKALELGFRVIATHKAVPFGPVRSEPYSVTDLPQACARYPEMNFEVVHSGFAFVEETALLVGACPNVWLNLEISGSFAVIAPRRFATLLGTFLQHGAEDRILFATGTPLVHPRAPIQAFLDFEMPADLIEGMGYPPITMDMKRKILGLNFLRLHGMDVDCYLAGVDGDRWSGRDGTQAEAWSHLRDRGVVQVA
jgi:predicted TIM-barrel fold metal-dependent hydrolase